MKSYALHFRTLKTKDTTTIIEKKCIKLILNEILWNIKRSLVINKYIGIYTPIDNIVWYEKMLGKQVEKKSLRGTYLVSYLNEVVMTYWMINLDFDSHKTQREKIVWDYYIKVADEGK
jgi:hypothetical protein